MADLIPFSLDKAKAGHPLVTRAGEPAKFIAHVPEATDHYEQLLVLIGGEVFKHADDGSYLWHPRQPRYDLFLAPKPKKKLTLWVNVYDGPFSDAGFDSRAHASQFKADRSVDEHRSRIGNRAWPLEIEVDDE